MPKYTYQQTVTVIQLADDCVENIYNVLTADDPNKGNPAVIISSDSVARILTIERNYRQYKFTLNGNYLAITDNHLWVMTPDELDAQDAKEG